MTAQDEGPSLVDIDRQLTELRQDIRELRNSFVSSKSWEEWRRENYAPRVERIELAADRLEARVDALLERINARFRTNTMSLLQGVIYPVAAAVLLFLLITQK